MIRSRCWRLYCELRGILHLKRCGCVMSFSLISASASYLGLTELRHLHVSPSVLHSVRGRGEKGRPIGSSCEVPEIDHSGQRARLRCSLRHGQRFEAHVSRSATRCCDASGSRARAVFTCACYYSHHVDRLPSATGFQVLGKSPSSI